MSTKNGTNDGDKRKEKKSSAARIRGEKELDESTRKDFSKR